MRVTVVTRAASQAAERASADGEPGLGGQRVELGQGIGAAGGEDPVVARVGGRG